MKFLADSNKKKEYITTTWFIEVISKWFSLITSRNPQVALGKNGTQESYQKYNEAVNFLHAVMKLFRNIQIGIGKIGKTNRKTSKTVQMKINNNENCIYEFKPVQTGIHLTTKSVIELSDYLLKEKHYLFVLAGRLTQDCVENLFSLVRARQPVPNALHFKQCLKAIAVSQYMKSLSNSSYEEDDREFIGFNFINIQKASVKKKKLLTFSELNLPLSNLNDDIELNVFVAF